MALFLELFCVAAPAFAHEPCPAWPTRFLRAVNEDGSETSCRVTFPAQDLSQEL